MDAITSLIEGDMGTVFDALDGRSGDDVARGVPSGDGINYRDEPVAFFFVLFGIVVEALLALSTKDADAGREDVLRLLMILQKILRPEVSGQAVYQETVFSETMDLLNRLVLTQTLEVQTVVVEIAKELCISHPSSRSSNG